LELEQDFGRFADQESLRVAHDAQGYGVKQSLRMN
jgi:hypothetical protein